MANGARLLSAMIARHNYYNVLTKGINMQQQNSHRAVALVKLPTMHCPMGVTMAQIGSCPSCGLRPLYYLWFDILVGGLLRLTQVMVG